LSPYRASTDVYLSSGYSSDESLKPIPRRHKHKRSKHLIRLERELGELPTLPSSFLSANPCLSQAMNILRRQARHISNESRELVREPEVAEPPCLDCRFERAMLFSGLAAEDAPLSPGLREALALIRSD
jgi:hypothetical protein